MPNAIEVLTQEHRDTEQMLKEIKQTRGEDADLLMTAAMELQAHLRIEEEVLYPFIRREVPEGDKLMQEAEKEHQEARTALEQVEMAAPGTDEFMQALETLEKGVKHHVGDEEEKVFPKLRETVDQQKLEQFGQELVQAKQRFMQGARVAGGSAGGGGGGAGGDGSVDDKTRAELYAEAKEIGIEGRSKMDKDELAQAVQRSQ